MTLFSANHRIVYFAHIPKTGGTTLSVVLRDSGAARALHHRGRVGSMPCPPQHMHRALFNDLVPDAFYDASVAVVRNPYTRLASEYGYRRRLQGRRIWPFNLWVRRMLGRFDSDPYVLENHIRPQTEFVDEQMSVFRYEDGLSDAIEFACDALGLDPVPTGHHNRGDAAPLRASSSTVDRIRTFYAADFDAFGYDSDDVPDRLTG